jgi:protein-disulfide isomerase
VAFVLVSLPASAETAVAQLPDVAIEVFSDFQCPFCAQFAAPIRKLQADGLDGVRISVTFRNFPLAIHSDAQLAHQAAMAAKEQGKFWEMHDLLFANRSAVKRHDILTYAEKLGLNMVRFRSDLDGERIRKLIEADVKEGQNRGLEGTPTFFLNGTSHTGTRTFEELQELVRSEVRRLQAISEIGDSLMARGPANAPVKVDLFADLASPMSQSTLLILDQLLEKYPSVVRLQFRNFPLAFHRLAGIAHEAAMDGARAGFFWEFATFILNHQDSLTENELIDYAGSLGLDKGIFGEELEQHRYHSRIDADLAEATRRGVRGSPSVFVNDKRIDGVPDLKTLAGYVEAELTTKPHRNVVTPSSTTRQ